MSNQINQLLFQVLSYLKHNYFPEQDFIQGFLYSKPLPLQDFLEYTEQFNQKEN